MSFPTWRVPVLRSYSRSSDRLVMATLSPTVTNGVMSGMI